MRRGTMKRSFLKRPLFTFTRGTVPVYRLYAHARSCRLKGTVVNGMPFRYVLQANKGTKLYWSWDEREIRTLGEKIWQETNTPLKLKKHLEYVRRLIQQAMAAAEEIRTLDLGQYDTSQLVARHQQFFDNFSDGTALADTDIDAVDIVPVTLLNALIEEELSLVQKPRVQKSLVQKPQVQKSEALDVTTKLTSPIFNSYVSAQEIAMAKIIARLMKEGITWSAFSGLKPSSEVRQMLRTMIDSYWWTCLGWENAKLKSEADYIGDLQHYQKKHGRNGVPELLQKIKDLQDQNKKVRQQREQLIQEYRFSKEVQFRLTFFDEYAALHDLRKEMQMRVLHSDDLFLQEFSRRLGLPVSQLEWYDYEELYDLLLGKKRFQKNDLEQRQIAYFMSNDVEILVGEAAARAIAEHYPPAPDSLTEIKGVCSSPGFAKGKVKVCAGYEEALAKIEAGDILVTGMTLPDYVPAMRKAAAIITDEGGITCHAAIVSRELKKPCITGTKIASHVLKDGDVVEVDADKGIVRKCSVRRI